MTIDDPGSLKLMKQGVTQRLESLFPEESVVLTEVVVEPSLAPPAQPALDPPEFLPPGQNPQPSQQVQSALPTT